MFSSADTDIASFISSMKKSLVLPQMPLERRKFVTDVSFY